MGGPALKKPTDYHRVQTLLPPHASLGSSSHRFGLFIIYPYNALSTQPVGSHFYLCFSPTTAVVVVSPAHFEHLLRRLGCLFLSHWSGPFIYPHALSTQPVGSNFYLCFSPTTVVSPAHLAISCVFLDAYSSRRRERGSLVGEFMDEAERDWPLPALSDGEKKNGRNVMRALVRTARAKRGKHGRVLPSTDSFGGEPQEEPGDDVLVEGNAGSDADDHDADGAGLTLAAGAVGMDATPPAHDAVDNNMDDMGATARATAVADSFGGDSKYEEDVVGSADDVNSTGLTPAAVDVAAGAVDGGDTTNIYSKNQDDEEEHDAGLTPAAGAAAIITMDAAESAGGVGGNSTTTTATTAASPASSAAHLTAEAQQAQQSDAELALMKTKLVDLRATCKDVVAENEGLAATKLQLQREKRAIEERTETAALERKAAAQRKRAEETKLRVQEAEKVQEDLRARTQANKLAKEQAAHRAYLIAEIAEMVKQIRHEEAREKELKAENANIRAGLDLLGTCDDDHDQEEPNSEPVSEPRIWDDSSGSRFGTLGLRNTAGTSSTILVFAT